MTTKICISQEMSYAQFCMNENSIWIFYHNVIRIYAHFEETVHYKKGYRQIF